MHTNRRHVLTLSAASAGLALLPRSLGAEPFAAPASIATSRFKPLLDRARSSLERHRGIIDLRDRVALADFSVASRDLRFHIVDLISGQTWSYLVAHGKGSDPEHTGSLQSFSNENGSLATSEGAYKTGEMYLGIHGRSMRLNGLDATNSEAEPRAIVIHGAPYVSENHIATWGKTGRSEGCFAVAPHMLEPVLTLLGPGRMLFAGKVTA